MKISFVYADKAEELNTSIYRNIIPWMSFTKSNLGHKAYLIPIHLFEQNSLEANNALADSDIIIVERNLFGDVLTRMMYWIVRGKIVIANYDDYYEGIEETNASYSFWNKAEIVQKEITTVEENYKYIYSDKYYKNTKKIKKNIERLVKKTGYPHPLFQFKLGLKIAHAQIMPSKYMTRKYNKLSPTYYVPNYFVTQNYLGVDKDQRDYLVIGWGGSLSHLQSFKDSGVIQALEEIIKERDNVKLLVCGDKRLLEVINIPDDKKLFHPYVKNEQWGHVIAKNFDIGLAPLEGEYDKCRSLIKPIEYMLTKTPYVASYGEAYKELAGIGGLGNFIKNSKDAWKIRLLSVIDNYDLEKEKMNGKPYEYALTWDYLNPDNVKYMVDTFKKIAKEHGKLDIE